MAVAEVIDLLSSEDEAKLDVERVSQAIPPASTRVDAGFAILEDEFDSILEADDARVDPPPKRRKLNLLRGSEVNARNRPTLPPLPENSQFARRVLTSTENEKASKQCPAFDGSDPIEFTSSLNAGTRSAHRSKKTSCDLLSIGDKSDDGFPELSLSTIPQRETASNLSKRTTALLATLSQPPLHDTSSKISKYSRSKSVSKDKDPKRHYDDENSSIPDTAVAPARSGKSLKNPKLSEEERLAKAQKKQKEKAEREREKEIAKALLKEQKARDKEEENGKKRLQKEEKAKEKQIAAAIAEVNKSKLDKKETTPEMIVDLPASMDGQNLEIQIKEYLKNLNVGISLYQSSVPNVIKWRRKIKARWNAELDYFEPLGRMEIVEEKHIMCIMSAKDFVNLVMKRIDDQDVEAHVINLKRAYSACIPIYLIEGLQSLLSRNRTAENRAYQAKVISGAQAEHSEATNQQTTSKRKQSAPESIDEDLIEDVLLRLQVLYGCLVHHTATTAETAEWVATFTQHISTIPYRHQYMKIETAFCIEPGQIKTGDDKNDTFVKMLQEVVRVTPPIAYGIASEYPNVLSLVQAFRRHGPNILEDLQKSANRDGAVSDRKVGQAISRRLYKVFMELNPLSTDV